MSYILDALRKADAQRERDPSRGIHAQPAAGLPARTGRRVEPWWWGAAALGLVAAAAGYVFVQRPAAPPPAAVPVTGFVKLQAPPPAVVPVATELSPPAPPPLPAPVQRAPAKTPVAAATLKAPPPATPVPAAASAPAMPSATPSTASAPAAAAPSIAAAPAAVPAAAQPAGAERILNVADLPASVQGELPKLAISGGVHSENAAQRMLIVGGQLKSEGAELAPGLVLEQIRPRTAVLRFKGFRYSLPY